jgi:hypothetical protein
MLSFFEKRIYKVKRGQTLKSLATEAGVTAYLLVRENALSGELFEGQILYLPPRGNLYTVRAGDSKRFLCGSEENYEKRNGTDIFYLGMKVLL